MFLYHLPPHRPLFHYLCDEVIWFLHGLSGQFHMEWFKSWVYLLEGTFNHLTCHLLGGQSGQSWCFPTLSWRFLLWLNLILSFILGESLHKIIGCIHLKGSVCSIASLLIHVGYNVSRGRSHFVWYHILLLLSSPLPVCQRKYWFLSCSLLPWPWGIIYQINSSIWWLRMVFSIPHDCLPIYTPL